MALIARIIGLSLLTAVLGVGVATHFFGQNDKDWTLAALVLGCVGAIVGAVAGAAQEIAAAQRQRVSD
jgi:hypothetical protein